MRLKLVLRILEWGIALLFGMAAVAKMDSMGAFADEIAGLLRIPSAPAALAAVAASAWELYLAAFLLFAPADRRGAVLIAALVTLAAYSALLLLRNDAGRCLCYGLGREGTLADLLDRHPLLRNGLMFLACGVCLFGRRSRPLP